MRKLHAAIALVALFVAQQAFADSDDSAPKPCKIIAKSCLKAGFERASGNGKMFWGDCMKPILLGQTVAGVTVDSKDATACREFKIAKMHKELKELQSVKTK